jgi:hypothetical protein
LSRPIYEPTLPRADAELGFSSRQLFRRPAPIAAEDAALWPWVLLNAGATTAPHNTWMPVPMEDISFDPSLVVEGDIFSWEVTDAGDAGNDRWQVTTHVEGFYEYELGTGWDQVTTNGTEPFGYAVQRLQPMLNDITLLEDIRASADWLRDDVDGDTSDLPGEMRDNPFLSSFGVLHCTGTTIWKPIAKQTTGVDRGLGPIKFWLAFRGASNNADWDTESV